MTVGYIRVSTEDQNLARQEVLMQNLKVEKVFADKASGKNTDRPEFKAMLEFVREGDVLCVESFSRLSRSTRDLLGTVEVLTRKGVTLVSDKEHVDTSTPQGRFMLTVFGALAELERENTLQRQREGIEIAKAAGKYKGRKPIEVGEEFIRLAKLWQAGEISLSVAVARAGVSRSTFLRKCRALGVSKSVVS